MSLEEALDRNTAALIAHTQALIAAGVSVTAQKPAKPAKPKSEEDSLPAVVKNAKAAEAAKKPEGSAGQESDGYSHVQVAVKNLIQKKGKDAIIGLLKEFEIAHAKELKPEQYDAFLEKAKALMSDEDYA